MLEQQQGSNGGLLKGLLYIADERATSRNFDAGDGELGSLRPQPILWDIHQPASTSALLLPPASFGFPFILALTDRPAGYYLARLVRLSERSDQIWMPSLAS